MQKYYLLKIGVWLIYVLNSILIHKRKIYPIVLIQHRQTSDLIWTYNTYLMFITINSFTEKI